MFILVNEGITTLGEGSKVGEQAICRRGEKISPDGVGDECKTIVVLTTKLKINTKHFPKKTREREASDKWVAHTQGNSKRQLGILCK